MPRTVPGYLHNASANAERHDIRTGADKALVISARSIIWISFIFMIFPAIDLVVSRWFVEESVFVLAKQPFLMGLREIGLKGPVIAVLAMLLLLVLHVLLEKRHDFCEPHKPLFVLLSFTVSQFLVEILKSLVGRARPRHLLEFGGSADFTPVWQFSAACARNCSFPSGEAAGAAAVLSLLVFVPAKQRRTAAVILTPVLMLISFNRVLFGAHFLSDVVLAWLFTILAMIWIWRWTEARSKRIDKFFTKLRPYRLAAAVMYSGSAGDRHAAAVNMTATAPVISTRDRSMPRDPSFHQSGPVLLSVVIPARNEADNIGSLVSAIGKAMAVLPSFEIIVVDDASTDDLLARLEVCSSTMPCLRVVRHAVPGGQSAAVHTGVLAARGNIVCTLDGDGQNPPEELPRLVAPLIGDNRGCVGLVAGQRVGRRDTLSKRLASRFANGLRARILRDGTRDTGCGLKAFRRDAFLALPYFDHMHRYLPALFARDGWEIVHIDVAHRARSAGRSNYSNLQRGLVGIVDLAGVAWLLLRRKKVRPPIGDREFPAQ